MQTYRCSICGTVNSPDIETHLGDYRGSNQKYFKDPKSPLHFICSSCNDWVEDQRREWEFLDNVEGW